MTASAQRWCEQHQRYECASLRCYRSTYCHSKPLTGTGTCRLHTAAPPAGSARELAHQQVATAIAEGRLTRPDACELCGAHSRDGRWKASCPIYGHHEDYARPLDVIWLCGTCHGRVHRRHGGLPGYLAWLRSQLAAAERIHERFYAATA